jgi:hypothetical protein
MKYSVSKKGNNSFKNSLIKERGVGSMVFNATFNNISAMPWQSVLLVVETGVPGENHRAVASHCQTVSHNVLSSTSRYEQDSNSQS